MEVLLDGLRCQEEDYHPGLKRMLVSICQGGLWPSIVEELRQFVVACSFFSQNECSDKPPSSSPPVVTHYPVLHQSPSPILCQIDNSYCGVTLFQGGPLPKIPSAKDLPIFLVLSALLALTLACPDLSISQYHILGTNLYPGVR